MDLELVFASISEQSAVMFQRMLETSREALTGEDEAEVSRVIDSLIDLASGKPPSVEFSGDEKVEPIEPIRRQATLALARLHAQGY